MKVGVLTAALQELTPREVRDADPDRAIEDWLEFARELGADYIQLSAALHPSRGGRAAGSDARSGGQHAGPAAAVRQDARAPCRGGGERTGMRISDSRTSTISCTTTRRRGRRSTTSCCACSTRRRCWALMRCAASSAATSSAAWTRTCRLRGALRPAAEGGEGARPDLPRRAVPDARLDDRRQLAQQHRLHAGRAGSRCIASARSTASATSSASTTTRRTRS